MNDNNLITEYNNINNELNEIINKINTLKILAEAQLKKAKNNDEKTSIFLDFKSKIDKIQQDDELKDKYKELNKKKQELEKKINKQNNMLKKNKQENLFVEDFDENSSNELKNKVSNDSNVVFEEKFNKFEKIEDDLKVLIKKYNKLVSVPVEIFKPDKKIKIKKIQVK